MVVQLPHQNFAAIKEELDIGFRELGVILTPDQRSSPVVYTLVVIHKSTSHQF
jgi:hypothetical protein